LHGQRSLQQLIAYFDRPGPAVPVDSTLGVFSVARHTEMPGPSMPIDSQILGLPPMPAQFLPSPPLPPESPPSQRISDDAEAAPDVSFAVNQRQAWDTATAAAVGSEQQPSLELERKAHGTDKSVADARGQEAPSQQLFEPVFPAPPRAAPWWEATQRRHSIAAPTASKTMGGAAATQRRHSVAAPTASKTMGDAAFSHDGLSGGLGNLQRSQSIFDLPEPGLALFAQNGSVPTPVRQVLQPPRGLDLEKISAGLLPPRGLLNPFMGSATPQAACWLGVDHSSMRHVSSMAMPSCASQGSATPTPYFGSFSMAQHGVIDYRLTAMQ
jgi:hypothetical protein